MPMSQALHSSRYVIVSPAKDEEKYLEATLRSVLAQTVKPLLWVLVDDGSQDNTPKILEEYATRCDWIKVVRVDRDVERRPSDAEIRAFQTGYALVEHMEFDFIVKLDCDLELPVNYFENLLAKFQEDPKLGIASGVYLEKDQKAEWLPVKMPWYHAAGASKVVRRQCFADIGGFVKFRIWDTADEVRAQMKGWHTRHFEELQFRHLKYEGSGIGFLKTNLLHGEIFYLCGGDLAFLSLKVGHRLIFGKPVILGGLAMAWGYIRAWASGKSVLFSKAEAQFYRRMLWHRVLGEGRGSEPYKAASAADGPS
jgi:biofilm PGA synthesis N-glycosyltransferase PgaC